VLLDADLAGLYGVSTKQLNQQVKRNPNRFPLVFCFQLTADETQSLRSHFVTSKIGRGGRRYNPYAFTEHGALMAANVLSRQRAINMSVQVGEFEKHLHAWLFAGQHHPWPLLSRPSPMTY
jgi:hypothetical protein